MADLVYNQVARVTDKEFSYGGYGTIYVSFAFNVRITIYETQRSGGVIGKLECWFNSGSRATARYVDQWDSGGGFWNAAGIMWGDGAFHHVETPLYNPANDSYSLMIDDLDDATSDYFIRFYFCDSAQSSTFDFDGPTGASFSRNLTTNDLDSNGNLKPLVLAKMFRRYYYHPDDVGPDNASVVEYYGDVESSEMGLNWKYYPWARKISGAWESCNRDINTASASRSAYLRHKESGSWQNVLNDMQGTTQMSWRKQSGSWKIAIPYGNNA